MQHIEEGEAKRASIKASSTNKEGYILVLKRMKHIFGQISQMSQASITGLELRKNYCFVKKLGNVLRLTQSASSIIFHK